MLISLEGFEIIGEAIMGQQGFGVFLLCPFAGFMVFTKEVIWQCNQDLASPWSAQCLSFMVGSFLMELIAVKQLNRI